MVNTPLFGVPHVVGRTDISCPTSVLFVGKNGLRENAGDREKKKNGDFLGVLDGNRIDTYPDKESPLLPPPQNHTQISALKLSYLFPNFSL